MSNSSTRTRAGQASASHNGHDKAAETALQRADQRRTFLATLWGTGDLPNDSWGYLWTLGSPGSKQTGSTTWAQRAAAILGTLRRYEQHDALQNLYICTTLAPDQRSPTERVTADIFCSLFGLFADIDIQHESHKEDKLPPDANAVHQLLAELGLEPTLIVDSGHGWHVWWLFPKVWVWDKADTATRERAKRLLAAWGERVKQTAAAHGWALDNVFEPARVLRIPGTINQKWRKDGTPLPPLEVTLVAHDPSRRYSVEDLEKFLKVSGDDAGAESDADSGAAGDDTYQIALTLAAAVLRPGHRWERFAPFVGMLWHGGIAEPQALKIVNAICDRAPTADRAKHLTTARNTYTRGRNGKTVAGAQALAGLVGWPIVLSLMELFESAKAKGNGKEGQPLAIVARALNTVAPEKIPWLWKKYLPQKQVTVLSAPGGAGKTHLLFDLTARAALGYEMPNGGAAVAPMTVAIVTSENDAGPIARPQIEAAMRRLLGSDPAADAKVNAALARVLYVDGVESVNGEDGVKLTVTLSFPEDTAPLRTFLKEHHVGMLLFDPLVSFTSDTIKNNDQAGVRRMMDALKRLAVELELVLITVIHFSKNVEGELITKVIGSRQFTDAARVVLSVIVEGRDDSPTGGTGIRRWLASAKNNLTKDPEALSFFITGDDDVDEASTIVWSYAKDANADELADDIEAAQQAQRGTARKTAADLLRKRCIALWTDGADVITAEELEALRLEADVSVSTWSKAKQDCGIKTGHNDQHDGWSAPLAGLDFLPKRPGQQEDDVNIIDPGPWWEQERKRRSRTRTRRARNAG